MYPGEPPTATAFVDTHAEFHDYCLSRNSSYAIAEGGLGFDAPLADRLAWFEQMTSVCPAP